jgi:hypothetical protein
VEVNELHTVKDILLAMLDTIEQDTTHSEKSEKVEKIRMMIAEVFDTPLR